MKKRYIIAGIFTGWLLYSTHHIYMGHSGSYSFKLYLFISILILVYLLCLKLTSYLADFKDINHQSRIEIVFLVIFFVMLFIPMSHISKDEISENENRTLAKWQPLLAADGNLNMTFGKDFDSWFNDRFAGRKELIDINSATHQNTVVETDKAIFNKKNNWMFVKGHYNYVLNDEFVNNAADILKEFKNFCDKNNIKLYVLIVPLNAEIYYDKISAYTNKYKILYNKSQVNNIKLHTGDYVVFPFDELKKMSKKDYVFFKTDWHWSDAGAYIGYNALINAMQKDYPQIKPVKNSDFTIAKSKMIRSDWERDYHIGEAFKFMFPSYEKSKDKILDTEYKYYTHKKQNLLKTKITNISGLKEKEFYYPYGNDLRVIEIGTSMNENLTGFTPYTFKHLKYIRLNNVKDMEATEQFKIIKYYKNNILQYKPDILIFCVTINNLPAVRNLFKE